MRARGGARDESCGGGSSSISAGWAIVGGATTLGVTAAAGAAGRAAGAAEAEATETTSVLPAATAAKEEDVPDTVDYNGEVSNDVIRL